LNRLTLHARIIELDALRYTPAGIAVQGLKLEHESMQLEAGAERRVRLELSAFAAGTQALKLKGIQPGSLIAASGFLAPRRQGSKSLVFHLTELNPIESKD
jgi:primosomal replication protein N